MFRQLTAIAALLSAAQAQSVCTLKTETHPSMSWQKCSSGGSCSTVQGSVVVDANWRWTHSTEGSTNCYTGNKWDSSICSTDKDCASKCCVDGADYQATYGIQTSGSALTLKFVQENSSGKNIGSRTYLMESETKYQMFNLLNNEFTFDVDVSNLPCGLNGALYFVAMDADGGMSKYPTNKAGAKYGTGYCDAQCPRDLKFINGEANIEGWKPSSNDANAGVGNYGSCCAEMDIWEANSMSTAFTPHPCDTSAQHRCEGDTCGGTYASDRYGGDCDPDGCDFNSYRMGVKTFYGPGMTVDTKSKFTVVTQFLTNSAGDLSEIKRFYVQGGKVIANSNSAISGVTGNSVTADFCTAQKKTFGDKDIFAKHGGLTQMGAAMKQGMVLVMSLWDDHYSNMLWLDSTYPVDSTSPGAARGSCATTSGVPAEIEASIPNSSVVFSNIKFGPVNSTYSSSTGGGGNNGGGNNGGGNNGGGNNGGGNGGTAAHWAQCGGIGYSGPTACASPYTCTKQNDYYSQCL